jgi:CheY-like chemotaxis protein
MHVLVVEDQDTIRRLVVDLLEADGHQVTACASGSEALLVLRSCPPLERVVLDWILPDGDATELLEALVAHESQPACIIISGYPLAVSDLPAAARPRCQILAKPFSPRALLAMLA